MRRTISVALAIIILAGFAPVASASGKLPPPKRYKNCTELRKVYPRGVARDVAAAGASGATVDAKTYKLNSGSDRDKDGIACE
jgi:hypothetical protein